MSCAEGCRENTTPNARGSCVRCGCVIPPWVLTDSYVREYYEAIGASDCVDEALARLHRGGDEYGWTDYLDKDNVQDAREEVLDAVHRAIFLTLKSRLRLAQGGDEEAAAGVTQLSAMAARQLVDAMRIFETVRDLER